MMGVPMWHPTPQRLNLFKRAVWKLVAGVVCVFLSHLSQQSHTNGFGGKFHLNILTERREFWRLANTLSASRTWLLEPGC